MFFFNKNKNKDDQQEQKKLKEEALKTLREDPEFVKTEKLLEKQDEQIAALNKARQLKKEGKLDEAIKLTEKTYADHGMIVNGKSWDLFLAELYYQNNMYDMCYKHMQEINKQRIFPEQIGRAHV